MSVESLQDELLHEVVSISQRMYKMRCSLASETDCDKLALGIREFSRLEGLQEGVKVAMLAIKKHIGD